MTASKEQNFIKRWPLLTYFILSYVFFWLLLGLFAAVVIGVLHLDPNTQPRLLRSVQIVGSWMPSLAAAIVVGINEGRPGVARLFGKLVQFRVPLRWILAGFIPVGVVMAAVLAYRLSGGAPEGGVPLTPGFIISMVMIQLFTGATGEEPGWRGFALPRMLQRFSPLGTGLLLGVLWGFWHLPVWMTTGYAGTTLLFYILAFIVNNISLSLLMIWFYRHVPDSLVPISFIHFTFNFTLTMALPTGLGLGATLPLFGWVAGILLLVTGIIWAFQGWQPAGSAAAKKA